LKFDFSVNTNALIAEPYGEINRDNREEYQIFKDSVWNSIKQFGTPNLYNQRFDASYTIPINKIPLLDWVSANSRYSSTYDWKRGPYVKPGTIDTKHNIKNSQQISLNSQFNMDNLYNKVGFLDKLNKKYKQTKKQRNKAVYEDVNFASNNLRFKGGVPRRVNHNLGTEEEIKVVVKQTGGNVVNSTFEIINENRVEITLERDAEDLIVEVTGKKIVTTNPIIIALEYTGLTLMGFKQFSASATQTKGIMVSGYQMDHNFNDLPQYPGLPFIFGWQYDDNTFIDQMVRNNMLIDSSQYIPIYSTNNNLTYNFKAQFQPVRDIRIDFAGIRSETENSTQDIFPNRPGEYEALNKKITGSYNINVWMLGSAFKEKPNKDNPRSVTFDLYKKNLNVIAWRLADDRKKNVPDGITYNPRFLSDTIYPAGYNSTNPDVAIPAFLAAYTDKNVNTVNKDFKSWSYFRPSWRVKFDGLKNIDFIGDKFRNISLSHGYMATFTVGSYGSNLEYNYEDAQSGYSWATGKIDNSLFISEYDIAGFSAVEQFVPLFGIDMTWKNNILTRFEYKKTRSLTMSLSNNQMNEVYTWEYTIGTGYRFDKLEIVVNGKPIVSDLNLRADFTIRDNASINHNLAQNVSQVTQGQKIYTFKFTADYQLTPKLTLQAYYDHNRNNPLVGSYNTANTEFGFMVRFSLAQ
jgi:cell surface protein SprA